MANPTYDYFGNNPVTIVMKTTDNFNGAAYTVNGAINKGVVTFPAQAGGGRLDFHKRPLIIKQISKTAHSMTFKIVYADSTEVIVAELTNSQHTVELTTTLPVGAYLKIESTGSGAKQVAIVAMEHTPGNSL